MPVLHRSVPQNDAAAQPATAPRPQPGSAGAKRVVSFLVPLKTDALGALDDEEVSHTHSALWLHSHTRASTSKLLLPLPFARCVVQDARPKKRAAGAQPTAGGLAALLPKPVNDDLGGGGFGGGGGAGGGTKVCGHAARSALVWPEKVTDSCACTPTPPRSLT
jgi:hypothetical protein